MKTSIFNNRIPLSRNTEILFNSFTEEYIVIRKGVSLESGATDGNTRSVLIEKGFMVDDREDESLKIHDAFMKASTGEAMFKLTVNPTLNCNFRCWYCYENHDGPTVMSESTVGNVKRFIERLSDNRKDLELSFFGGEPLLHFNNIVEPLITHTHKLYSKAGLRYAVTFTTNGFLISDSIISRLRPYKMGISQITLDGGPDCHNRIRVSSDRNSFQTIVDNITRMTAAGMPVLLRVNVTAENIDGAGEIPEYFSQIQDKANLKVLIQQVWQDTRKNDILDEIWDLYGKFMEYGIMPWPRRFNFYKDICYADRLDSAVINHDGKVYRCTAIDFDRSGYDGILSANDMGFIESAFLARVAKRASNALCAECRILPLCNGGCCKNVDQAKVRDYCLHPRDEDKDKVVRNTIREQLHMSRLGLSWKQPTHTIDRSK